MRKAGNTFLHEGGWLRALPFVMLFIYCITIYQFVYEQYDDYFFGALSAWGYTEPDVVGTNFTCDQLLHFASVLYKTRLPRVLSLVLINAPLLRVQWLYRIINSIGIVFTFYGVYRYSGAKQNMLCVLFSVLLFGLLSQRMYTEGAFWFTACLITFDVNALMFLSLLLFKSLESKSEKSNIAKIVGCCFLSVLTCLMQEITAFTLCGTFALIIIYKIIIRKKIPVDQCIAFGFAVLGAVVICFGPGNLHRLQTETIATLSTRVAVNLDNFITTIFHKSNLPFLIVFLFFTCYLSCKQERRGKRGLLSTAVCLWSVAFIPLSLYYSSSSTLDTLNNNYTMHSTVLLINGALYLSYAGFLIARQLIEIKDVYLSVFGISGLLSVISAFFYSTYIVHRMEICLYLAIFCIMVRVFSEEKCDEPRKLFLFGVSIISCLWLAVFWVGYAKNAPILQANRDILISTGARIAAGEPIVTPVINAGYNHYFTVEHIYPAEPESPYIYNDLHAMKEYYRIPDEIDILYN